MSTFPQIKHFLHDNGLAKIATPDQLRKLESAYLSYASIDELISMIWILSPSVKRIEIEKLIKKITF